MMIRYGVDYYPEHWPEERWATDAEMMREAHFNTVRLAEFAWGKLEPAAGQYDFDWLDRAIDVLNSHGMDVVLGTPTASPPPWLMADYPDAFLLRADGQRATYGGRREYCPNHAGYRQRSQAITRAMADHYAGHPGVIGWQTDNEFGDRCYCAHCQRQFHQWLQARYPSLDALNDRWGTIFWSHTYSDWSQIPTPQSSAVIHNPGLELDYLRFMSDTYVDFQREQIDILRERCGGQFITHNLMGFQFDKLNYFDLARDLDFVSWDNYPRGFWIDEMEIDANRLALGHVTMYGLRNQPFWVMEAQSGPAGWTTVGATPRPGEIRLWAYQGIAHGADGIIYFRWRTARFGAEQYWHGVLSHDGQPNRRYDEVRQMGSELARIGERIQGAEVRAACAILLSYDARFAFQIQPNNPAFSYARHIQDYFSAFNDRHVSVQVISPETDLAGFRLVVAPALHLVTPDVAERLRAYVEGGGVLVVTTRSGVKDWDNTAVDQPLPGLLADLCGVEIHDYDSLLSNQTRAVAFGHDKSADDARATVWCDLLTLKTADAAARYGEDFYAGEPAISLRHYGRGSVIYVGTVGNKALVNQVAAMALDSAAIESTLSASAGVEVAARWQEGQRLLFVLNHGCEAATIELDRAYSDLLTGRSLSGAVSLAANDVLILV